MAQESIATLVARLVADSTGFKAGLDSAQRDLNSFSARARREGQQARTAFAGVGAAWTSMAGVLASVGVGIGLANLARDAAQFERQIAVIGAATRATGAQSRELSATVRRLGLDFGIGANNAALAANELQQAGVGIADINAGVLDSSIELARVLGDDYVAAAEIAAKTMNVFRIEVEDFDEAVQGIGATVLAGGFQLSDYELALTQGARAAIDAKISLEDFNTLLLLFQRRIGGSGSDMGTLARTFLSRLVPASEEARLRMRALGLEFFNQRGQFVGLEEAARRAQAAMGGLSTEQRTLDLNLIAGADARRAYGVLIDEGAEGIREMTRELHDQADISDVVAAKTAGFAGATERLAAAWQDLGIAIGESGILDVMAALTNWAAGGVRTMSRGAEALGQDARNAQYWAASHAGDDPLVRRLRREAERLEVPYEDVEGRLGPYALWAIMNSDLQRGRNALQGEHQIDESPFSQGRYQTYGETPFGRLLRQRIEEQMSRVEGFDPASMPGFRRPVQSPSAEQMRALAGLPPTAATEDAAADLAGGDGALSESQRRDIARDMERFLDETERVLAESRGSGLEGGPNPLDDLLDRMIEDWEAEMPERLDRVGAIADRFGKGVSDAFRDAWINDDWDWSSLSDRILKEFRAAIWDAMIGDQITAFMQFVARAAAGNLQGLIGNSIAGAGTGDSRNPGEGGWLGTILRGLGRSFGGGFAEGGQLGPGQWGIAGENGPEPIYGGRTGMTIYPASESGGAALVQNFTIDARGADAGVEARIRIAVQEAAALGARQGAAMVFKKVRAGQTR